MPCGMLCGDGVGCDGCARAHLHIARIRDKLVGGARAAEVGLSSAVARPMRNDEHSDRLVCALRA